MKHSYLAIALSASALMLASCSTPSTLSLHPPVQEEASAQPASPAENLQTARKLAWEAAVQVQHPPHSVETWQGAKVKWRQAIRLLEEIPKTASVSAQATQKLALYRANYTAISQRLEIEQAAVDNLEKAQTLAWQAAVTVQKPPHTLKTWQRAHEKWAAATSLLAAISPQASVAPQVRAKVVVYRNNFNTVAQRIQTEEEAQATLQQFADTANRLNTLQINVINGQSADAIGVGYEEYSAWVKSLRSTLSALSRQPGGNQHPLYQELSVAISDYEFALDIWQSYLTYKRDNASWLNNEDFFNQLLPLSRIDSRTLLHKYQVKIYQGAREAKVPLKFTLWAIWEQAGQRVNISQRKAASFS